MKARGSSVRASSGQRSSFFVALMIPFNARLRAGTGLTCSFFRQHGPERFGFRPGPKVT